MKNKYVFPITKDFDYFEAGNFRTKKLEGTVELKKSGLPGSEPFFINQKLYMYWKQFGKFPREFKSELKEVLDILIEKYSRITVRTCFRFSGYENPRSLPAFRDLVNQKQVLQGIEDAYKAGEDFAGENKIDWFELGLILMGRVEGERAGIILVDPKDSNLCVIESCWGDIHLIATGENDLDSFWVNRKGKIVNKKIREKKKAYYFNNGKRVKKNVPKSKISEQSISDAGVKRLAKSAFKAADYHKSSVEIEYMIREDGFVEMYELQERPGLKLEIPKKTKEDKLSLVSGVVVNGGEVEGTVKVVTDLNELKNVDPGAVLVLPSKMMGEDIPIIGKVGALITDTGGFTAHISTIAKECNIPCIVGTENASKKLKNGMKVRVDANNGRVYDAKSFKGKRIINFSNQVVWLEEVKANMDLVGAKAFNLIGLMQLGMNVPNAYVITTDAFDKYITKNKIKKYIQKVYKKIDVEELGKYEEKISSKILKGKFDNDLKKRVFKSFNSLKGEYGEVAVRSSATCEDSVKASFAGQFQSFLFVDDRKTLIESIKKCWASLFRAGAVLYSIKNGINISKVRMAVIVQGMIPADTAGVMFTKDIESEDGKTVLIEAAKGIGENVVSGEVTPVSYTVVKDTGRIISKEGDDAEMLTNSQVLKLTKLGKKIEESFGMPCDIEWALKENKIHVLQTRPITT